MISGKICSGKTYYSKKLRDEFNGVILSIDEITFDLIENKQDDFYYIFVERVRNYFNKKAIEIVNSGANVIYEAGLWTNESRIKTKKIFSR